MKINIRNCEEEQFVSTILGEKAIYELQFLNESGVASYLWVTKKEFEDFGFGNIEWTLDGDEPYTFGGDRRPPLKFAGDSKEEVIQSADEKPSKLFSKDRILYLLALEVAKRPKIERTEMIQIVEEMLGD